MREQVAARAALKVPWLERHLCGKWRSWFTNVEWTGRSMQDLLITA